MYNYCPYWVRQDFSFVISDIPTSSEILSSSNFRLRERFTLQHFGSPHSFCFIWHRENVLVWIQHWTSSLTHLKFASSPRLCRMRLIHTVIPDEIDSYGYSGWTYSHGFAGWDWFTRLCRMRLIYTALPYETDSHECKFKLSLGKFQRTHATRWFD